MLTGHLPFEGPLQAILYQAINTLPPKPSTLRPEIDDRLERICLKALSKKPEDRFPSCKAFADILRSWQSGTSKVLSGQTPLRPPPAARRDAPTLRKSVAGKRSTVSTPLPVAPVADEVIADPVLIQAPTGLSRRGWLLLAVGLALPILAGAGVVIVNKLRTNEKEKSHGPGLRDLQRQETK
jgi:serine/threonine-protein kinase